MPGRKRTARAATIIKRLESLAAITSEPGRTTRHYLTAEHRQAAHLVMGWMRQAGMTPSLDAVGNVVGRYDGDGSDPRTLLLGAPIDAVRDAGSCDDGFGVVVAIEAVADLARRRRRLPCAVEVVAFADSQGARFGRHHATSRPLVGLFDALSLDDMDGDGVSRRAALAAFGCDVDGIARLARRSTDTLAYIEVGVERGPVLETERLPVGVVTVIAGATRIAVDVRVEAGRSSAEPIGRRRDALAAAAEMILAVEALERSTAGLTAGVGRIDTRSSGGREMAKEASFAIDIKSPVDRTRRAAQARTTQDLRAIARRRGLRVTLQVEFDEKSASSDPRLVNLMSDAIERAGSPPSGLPCGTYHDAATMAHICPAGMLLVRCREGAMAAAGPAHKPDDIETAARVLLDVIDNVARLGGTAE